MPAPSLPPPEVLAHLVDVHCHPAESPIEPRTMAALTHTLCAMSSRLDDQPRVRALAEQWPDKVIPAFGYHPWFTHHIALSPTTSTEAHYRALFLPGPEPSPAHEVAFARLLPSLPPPMVLSDLLAGLRKDLADFPGAMLGEVGIDRAARVPFRPLTDATGGDEERRELSPFTTPFAHQLAILEAQLNVAAEMRRNVSMHSVKAAQQTRELFDRMKTRHGKAWRKISVDLHSCGLSQQVWTEIEKNHPNAFLSLSTVINARSPNHRLLIEAVNPSRLLVESDFHDVRYSAERTWEMTQTVGEVKGWRLEELWDYEDADNRSDVDLGTVKRLEDNWKRFVRGGHKEIRKLSRKERWGKWDRWGDSESEED